MAKDAQVQPKFPWDYDVPNDAFWNSVDYTVARNFMQCYDHHEFADGHFDDSLSYSDKLSSLKAHLNLTLQEKEKEASPKSLHDADYTTWRNLKLALSTMDHFLGNTEEEERVVREVYGNGQGGTKNMSALHQLSGIVEKSGRYKEAEEMAMEVLPWMQGHELLGNDSPQALSCIRILATSVWKQKRFAEGAEWLDKYGSLINEMGEGKFAKYKTTEEKLYTDCKKSLIEWRKQE